MFKRSIVMFGLLLLVLTGCTQARQESIEKKLELKIKLTMLEPGRVSISVGMFNPAIRDYRGNEDFNGILTITDDAGNTVADVEAKDFPSLPAGATDYPSKYDMTLEPGTYMVQFSALGKTPVEMKFEIVEKDGVMYLNAPYEFIDPFTMYTNAS